MRGIEHMAALGTHERQSLTAWEQLGQRRISCEVRIAPGLLSLRRSTYRHRFPVRTDRTASLRAGHHPAQPLDLAVYGLVRAGLFERDADRTSD